VSFTSLVESELARAGIAARELEDLIRLALDEDLRYGPDVTSEATVVADAVACADVVARARGVLCGVPVALAVLETLGVHADQVDVMTHDGESVEPATVALHIVGPVRSLLLGERTLLNFMTHLSGIATATRQWVRALEGTGCVLRDTRKTVPGLRQLEKYAVRCGGGENHRMGLGDVALIKDNHVVATGGIGEAISAVRSFAPDTQLEVECDTLDQVREAVAAGSRLILLDNMDLGQLRTAVGVARERTGVRLEASGGMTLANARAVAQTGVDYIAVGALTHSSPALDLALDLRR
jgi:nicotinate-nucleotide pyrophosphorylase (carboxylating)